MRRFAPACEVHAIVATAVPVVNTASTPLPVNSINDPGRVPYQATSTQLLPSQTGGTLTFVFAAVPSNHRLVIQHVSGYLAVASGSTSAGIIGVAAGNTTAVSNFFSPTLSGLNAFDAPILAIVDQGLQPEVTVYVPTWPAASTELITLSGYMIDCSVAACSPVIYQ